MVSRKTLFTVIVLIIVSPVFGVEPLDVAAEMLNLEDITEDINWTIRLFGFLGCFGNAMFLSYIFSMDC